MKLKKAILETFEEIRFAIVEVIKFIPKLLFGFGVLLFLAVPTFALFTIGMFFFSMEFLFSSMIIWIFSQLIWGYFWVVVLDKMMKES